MMDAMTIDMTRELAPIFQWMCNLLFVSAGAIVCVPLSRELCKISTRRSRRRSKSFVWQSLSQTAH
jgi:hypothetical protein